MILGVGIDLVDMRRLKAAVERYEQRFFDRILTPAELAYCQKNADPIAALARHYAFKEAASKALGTGMTSGVNWRNLELCRLKGRKPFAQFHGAANERLASLTPQGHRAVISVSISDEPPYANAICIIDAQPA